MRKIILKTKSTRLLKNIIGQIEEIIKEDVKWGLYSK